MTDWSRRQFIAAGGGVIAGVGLGGLYTATGRAARGEPMLRPPGALEEDAFLAACIRCGQCVEACPHDVLKLTDLDQGAAAATPYFIAKDNPCNLCMGYESLECIDACPTAALGPVELEDINIGLAHICKGTCLAYNGTICRACWHVCPFPDQAIVFDEMLRPRVRNRDCIGCGLCEHACPTEPRAVTITPLEYIRRNNDIIHNPGHEGEHDADELHGGGGGQGVGRGEGVGRDQGRGQGRGRNREGGDP